MFIIHDYSYLCLLSQKRKGKGGGNQDNIVWSMDLNPFFQELGQISKQFHIKNTRLVPNNSYQSSTGRERLPRFRLVNLPPILPLAIKACPEIMCRGEGAWGWIQPFFLESRSNILTTGSPELPKLHNSFVSRFSVSQIYWTQAQLRLFNRNVKTVVCMILLYKNYYLPQPKFYGT